MNWSVLRRQILQRYVSLLVQVAMTELFISGLVTLVCVELHGMATKTQISLRTGTPDSQNLRGTLRICHKMPPPLSAHAMVASGTFHFTRQGIVTGVSRELVWKIKVGAAVSMI